MRIKFITDRNEKDKTLIYLKEIFSFHSITFSSIKLNKINLEKSSKGNILLLDQIVEGVASVEHLKEIHENLAFEKIYLLTSKVFTEEEEMLINKFKISVFTLPINETEIFNRIIN